MSNQFRELLKKVGGGQHTKKDLTRLEAAIATRMMLQQEATPAQIGAFLIAHRIKRPTMTEIAGMLDIYTEIGPKLNPFPQERPVMVFGIPYDGRTRTAPISPLTALILASAGVAVILHGGDVMPTKYGLPLIEVYQGLGLDFTTLSLAQAQEGLEKTNIGFIYIPQHFPAAQGLIPYRDQLGKRPPIATLELIWSPYPSYCHLVAGYVHPPTEILFRDTLKLREQNYPYTFTKGLEGSCDLRLSQTTIVVISQPETETGFDYLKLHPQDYGMQQQEIGLESKEDLILQMKNVLQGKSSNLMKAAIWNSGFYLWRAGLCADLALGLTKAEQLLNSGQVSQKVAEIAEFLELCQHSRQLS